jgi:PhnB protein
MPTKPIPEGFHAITPYLFARGASRLIEFIAAAFEGELIFQQKRPDGAVMHATMRIGDSMLMLADATREFGPICLDHVQTNRYGGFRQVQLFR